MVKRRVEVKLPSACPGRHSNPVLFVPLTPYVLVALGSTPLQTRTHVDAWHQCIMPGPIILICSNIKIMKYNYFFIEIGIYRSRFDTQYI